MVFDHFTCSNNISSLHIFVISLRFCELVISSVKVKEKKRANAQAISMTAAHKNNVQFIVRIDNRLSLKYRCVSSIVQIKVLNFVEGAILSIQSWLHILTKRKVRITFILEQI